MCVVCDAPRIRSRQRKHRRVHNISSDVYWWSKPGAAILRKKNHRGEMQPHAHTHGNPREPWPCMTYHPGNSSSRAVNWWTCDRVICHFYWQWLRIIWDEEWTLSLETNSLQFTQFKFNFLLRHHRRALAAQTARMNGAPYVTKFSPRDFWRPVEANYSEELQRQGHASSKWQTAQNDLIFYGLNFPGNNAKGKNLKINAPCNWFWFKYSVSSITTNQF